MRSLPEWDRLGFKFRETDEFYRSLGDQEREPVWDSGELLPFGPVELSPAAAFLSYGLGIFEGLKARRGPDGRVLLFRHRDNAKRFQRSAERLLMAPFPEQQFVDAIEGLVARNERWVPPHGKGSLYIRPLQHAIGARVGIRPSSNYWVLIFVCPVASYFGSDAGESEDGVRLRVLEQGRCAPGGTGSAKVMGCRNGRISAPYQNSAVGKSTPGVTGQAPISNSTSNGRVQCSTSPYGALLLGKVDSNQPPPPTRWITRLRRM